jgi:glycosyltransferase involved in cell wall biosynthesis
MNILVIAGSLRSTQAGAAHATLEFANTIAKRNNIKVYLYTFDVNPKSVNERVEVIKYKQPTPIRFLWRFEYLERYYQSVKNQRERNFGDMDICYTQNDVWGLVFRRFNRDIPIVSHTGAVLSFREYLEERSPDRSIGVRINAKLANWFEGHCYKTPLWAHMVSTPLVGRARAEHFKLGSDFFDVCPFGVDFSIFKPKERGFEIRTRLGIPEKGIVIITVARLVAWKNIDMVVSAFSRIKKEGVYLTVLGEGREKARLIKMAEELGVGKKCYFLGHIENPAEYYAESDIFVLPSKIESFGIVYAEAMASGLPCIGLKNSPPEVLSTAIDVIEEGKCGYCVSSEDELVNKLEGLIGDPAMRRRMSANSIEFARKRYSVEKYVDRFLEIAEKKFGISSEPGINKDVRST